MDNTLNFTGFKSPTVLGGTPIAIDKLQTPVAPAVIPPAPTVQPPPTGLLSTGFTSPTVLTGTPASQTTTGTTATQTTEPNWYQKVLEEFKSVQPVSQTDIYNKAKEEAQIQQKQQAVNDLTAQLNQIVAGGQAQKIALTGQGRGITTGILGGQSAQIDRQTAIQALPVQAQVQAAQGNLQAAQDSLATSFKLQSEDADRQYQYRVKLFDSLMAVASDEQKAKLEDKRLQEERAYQEGRANFTANTTQQKELISSFKDSGQTDLAAQAIALDPNSPDFRTRLSELQSQLKTSKEVATYREVNGTTYALDKFGNVIKTIGASVSTAPAIQAEVAKGDILSVQGLIDDSNLSRTVGPSALARGGQLRNLFTGGKNNFIASIDQLKSKLSLDSLINAKARGATFGALSDSELKILASSATKLSTWEQKDSAGNVTGYSASEKDFKRELDKINNFAILDFIKKGGNPADVGAITMPDGSIIKKNSDGTYQKFN